MGLQLPHAGFDAFGVEKVRAQVEPKGIITWIFLSIAYVSQVKAADFASISQIADDINHAVPTAKELQESVTYLVAHHWVKQEGKKYTLTDSGKQLIANAEEPTTRRLEKS